MVELKIKANKIQTKEKTRKKTQPTERKQSNKMFERKTILKKSKLKGKYKNIGKMLYEHKWAPDVLNAMHTAYSIIFIVYGMNASVYKSISTM